MRKTSDPPSLHVFLKPSTELHVYDPELPVVKVKQDVTNNKDEQEENDTLVPAWLTRLRDRRMREVKARTAEGAEFG